MLCSKEIRVSVATTPGDALHLVVKQVHELFVVACVELYEHGVRTSGEVALNDFGYVVKALNYRLIHVSALKRYATYVHVV